MISHKKCFERISLLGEVIDLKLCLPASKLKLFANDPPLHSVISASFSWWYKLELDQSRRSLDKGVSRTNQILSRETHPTQLDTIEEGVRWCAD